jgi:hypothetical protein
MNFSLEFSSALLMYLKMATTVCEMYGCQTSYVYRIVLYFITYFSVQ